MSGALRGRVTAAAAASAKPAAVVPLGDKWGTDLATECDANGCTTGPRRVYSDTHTGTDMCHRATSAEVVSTAIPDVTAMTLSPIGGSLDQ